MDASSHDPWIAETEVGDIQEPVQCVTVGFLLSVPTKKKPVYMVASTIQGHDDGEVCCIMKIPKGCVTSIEELEHESKPEPKEL